jgi:hypothetical protein
MKPADNEMLGDVVFIIAWCSFVQFARKGRARKKENNISGYRGVAVSSSLGLSPCLSALSLSDMAG